MAQLTVKRGDLYPVGTVVKAFTVTPAEQIAGFVRAGEPAGTLAATATVNAAGALVLEGLGEGTPYVLWASVSGKDTYLQVRPGNPGPDLWSARNLNNAGTTNSVEAAAIPGKRRVVTSVAAQLGATGAAAGVVVNVSITDGATVLFTGQLALAKAAEAGASSASLALPVSLVGGMGLPIKATIEPAGANTNSTISLSGYVQ